MADAGLIFAFVKRWHRETNSFHLPFGEMFILLDDVATLLHISPHGKFFDASVNMNTNNAAIVAHEYLGATWEKTLVEINYNKCPQYRLQWLCDLYSRLIRTNQFECATRTYMLHLVDSPIFADKTHTRVEAKYISLFIDLDRCQEYSWATAILVFLYDNLGDGAVHDTRQLGGGLMTYHRRIDALLLKDVVFTPYDDDRANHPFVSILTFSEYLRCGGVSVPYLPERCLRQFGRIQCDVPPVTADYYAWYISVSHPLILPPSTVAPSSRPTVVAHGPSSSVHAGPSSTQDRRAAELVRRAINLVAPFSELHDILHELSLLYDD
uniref:Protein MAIN-LIKE 1-like n=1 Tax=Cicer arietinum TaxID=3827 RepID=A0A1S3ECB9_CICAR|nr:protein MAIN-LIKE 1-like [Cicer arietinum]